MKKRAQKRGNWYLLTGLILGVGLGLVYAWMISPVEYVDAGPYSLREDFKDQYRLMIALAYMADDNFERAKARLDQLKDPNIAQTIAMQAQRFLADGRPEMETRAIGMLAVALGEGPLPTRSVTTGETPKVETTTMTPTLVVANPSASTEIPGEAISETGSTLQPTATPLPTRTPTATPGEPFLLAQQDLICDPALSSALIQVQVYDAAGQAVPGVEVIVSWEGNEEHFFTGLKPELGLGYADFTMTIDETYTLHLADGGEPVTNLTVAECEGDGGARYYGSWSLVFRANGR